MSSVFEHHQQNIISFFFLQSFAINVFNSTQIIIYPMQWMGASLIVKMSLFVTLLSV